MRNRPLPMTNPQAILGQAGNDNQLTNQQKKAHEAQQATVLFVIVANFFICHTLRFALNLHEFLTLDSIRALLTDDACVSFSYGGFCAVSISHCLMTLNSSVNFFIYACTSSNFVKVSWIKVVDLKCIQFLARLKNDVFGTNDSNDVVFIPQVSPPNELNNTRNTRIISDSSYRQPAVDPCFVWNIVVSYWLFLQKAVFWKLTCKIHLFIKLHTNIKYITQVVLRKKIMLCVKYCQILL